MFRSHSFKFFTRARACPIRVKRSFASHLSPPSILGPTERNTDLHVNGLYRASYFDAALLAQYDFLHSWPFSKIVNISGLTRLNSNTWLKLPHHITGTIKDRVVLYVLLDMIRSQELVDNSNIIAVSSGSYAVSLMVVKYIINKFTGIKLNTTIVVPNVHRQKEWIKDLTVFATFSGNPMQIIEASEDINKFDFQGHDNLLFTDLPFGQALVQAKQLATHHHLKFIDQQADTRHVDAHAATAKEILLQYPNVTDIVVPVGTGATAMGLKKNITAAYKHPLSPCKNRYD